MSPGPDMPLGRNVPAPPTKTEYNLRDGWYWFKSGRAEGIRSIAQYADGVWWTANEIGPIDIAELNRRGWTLDKRVKYRRKKHAS